ncbi:MAG: AbrB family transcriptional regulator [Hydrogenophilales bacterium CG03_land_8_20_14_0_80_62_28]|nr:AbrB/MazE/SpoVT family DNA-binding domain-containing protein [Betaproteobacteria bacterium]PIV23985.1 MAG: AbrB family transcriptional regulator [Hydrogenophilales bacterium CG03_land_8_20_14_0_80_62_28]PIW71929.1 MAG: AbrB family transcriptional regulator [Hydrogenophilales bacterium CG12_big_fil_rev_8_21_14_0_65_61_21]PIX02481.1 MAG: AbrB family transcriptional regulator [Hydrogenophilales bacterium CG_4_8_14_3_um_filter_62_83]PIY97363.1 MAG: AbrB family transcriptional regulator [Hydrogen
MMQLTVSRWGNSLAVRIPAEVARDLALEEGALVDCETTPAGTLELVPAGKKARAEQLQGHFAQVNAHLADQAMTTPAAQLLREEERY